jgi:hypothetical protein
MKLFAPDTISTQQDTKSYPSTVHPQVILLAIVHHLMYNYRVLRVTYIQRIENIFQNFTYVMKEKYQIHSNNGPVPVAARSKA